MTPTLTDNDTTLTDNDKIVIVRQTRTNIFYSWKMARIFQFIEKFENLKSKFFPYKMSQNTCNFFKIWLFQKYAQNLLIQWEIRKSENPIQNGSNTCKFFKIWFFFRKLFIKMPYHLGADNFDCKHYPHLFNSIKAY